MADTETFTRPETTLSVTRGVMRAFLDLGFAPVLELTLANGRRADVCGINDKGEIAIAEVKSCVADFAVDLKWPEYREFCDRFYFAVPPEFPLEILPDELSDPAPGLILADKFGGAVLRPSAHIPIAPARRKAMTNLIARQAATRLAFFVLDA